MDYPAKVEAVLALVNLSYEELAANLNNILPVVKGKIQNFDTFGPVRLSTFETTLAEELKDNPVRRAYRTAILTALGERVQETPGSVKKRDSRKRS